MKEIWIIVILVVLLIIGVSVAVASTKKTNGGNGGGNGGNGNGGNGGGNGAPPLLPLLPPPLMKLEPPPTIPLNPPPPLGINNPNDWTLNPGKTFSVSGNCSQYPSDSKYCCTLSSGEMTLNEAQQQCIDNPECAAVRTLISGGDPTETVWRDLTQCSAGSPEKETSGIQEANLSMYATYTPRTGKPSIPTAPPLLPLGPPPPLKIQPKDWTFHPDMTVGGASCSTWPSDNNVCCYLSEVDNSVLSDAMNSCVENPECVAITSKSPYQDENTPTNWYLTQCAAGSPESEGLKPRSSSGYFYATYLPRTT